VFRVTQSRLVGIAWVGNIASAFWVLMFSYLFSKRAVYPCFLLSGSIEASVCTAKHNVCLGERHEVVQLYIS